MPAPWSGTLSEAAASSSRPLSDRRTEDGDVPGGSRRDARRARSVAMSHTSGVATRWVSPLPGTRTRSFMSFPIRAARRRRGCATWHCCEPPPGRFSRTMSGTGGTLRPAARTQDRRAAFKKTMDADESRRKREDAANQLRKEKKEHVVEKKRRETLPPGVAGTLSFGDGRSGTVRVRAWPGRPVCVPLQPGAPPQRPGCARPDPPVASPAGQPAGHGAGGVQRQRGAAAVRHHAVPEAPLHWSVHSRLPRPGPARRPPLLLAGTPCRVSRH